MNTHGKLCQKIIFLSRAPFCLRRLEPFERCARVISGPISECHILIGRPSSEPTYSTLLVAWVSWKIWTPWHPDTLPLDKYVQTNFSQLLWESRMVSWPFDSNKFEQDSNDLAFPTWIYLAQNENTIQKIVKTNFIPGFVGNPNGTSCLDLFIPTSLVSNDQAFSTCFYLLIYFSEAFKWVPGGPLQNMFVR